MTKTNNEHKLLLFVAEHVNKKTKITQNSLALCLGVHLNTLRKNKKLLETIEEINQNYIKQSKNTRDISSLPKKGKSSSRFKRVANKKYYFMRKNREFRLITQDNTQDLLCKLFDSFFEHLTQTKSNKTDTLNQYAKSLTKCLNQISINHEFSLECESKLTPKSNNEKTVWHNFFCWGRENYQRICDEEEKQYIEEIENYYKDF